MKKSFLTVLVLTITLSFILIEVNAFVPHSIPNIKSVIVKGYYFEINGRIIGIIAVKVHKDKSFICFGVDTVDSDLFIESPFGINTTLFGLMLFFITSIILFVAIQSKRSKVESKAEE
ncbi:MAG: hypothetical protein COA79_22920 [Planctomycetota bacterium]|nr:MAG: hypothetical protein COA79_22920 [Planctomycetota bacterium]